MTTVPTGDKPGKHPHNLSSLDKITRIQAYSNLDSVVQNFIVTWNCIYTGTPLALRNKVNERNYGSGLATRLTVIPLPSTNFEMMERETRIDFESDERLKMWAFKLDRVKGELTVQKIVDELYDWTARRMADAKENDSKAEEMLLKRLTMPSDASR